MTKNEFYLALQDMLQCSEDLEEATVLADLEEWDSLAFMVVITFFSKNFQQKIVFDDLKTCKTVADLVALAKGAIA